MPEPKYEYRFVSESRYGKGKTHYYQTLDTLWTFLRHIGRGLTPARFEKDHFARNEYRHDIQRRVVGPWESAPVDSDGYPE